MGKLGSGRNDVWNGKEGGTRDGEMFEGFVKFEEVEVWEVI